MRPSRLSGSPCPASCSEPAMPSATSRAATTSCGRCSRRSDSPPTATSCGSSAIWSIAARSRSRCCAYVRALGDNAIVVLGNHDLHLLAVACGCRPARRSDTLDEILRRPTATRCSSGSRPGRWRTSRRATCWCMPVSYRSGRSRRRWHSRARSNPRCATIRAISSITCTATSRTSGARISPARIACASPSTC